MDSVTLRTDTALAHALRSEPTSGNANQKHFSPRTKNAAPVTNDRKAFQTGADRQTCLATCELIECSQDIRLAPSQPVAEWFKVLTNAGDGTGSKVPSTKSPAPRVGGGGRSRAGSTTLIVVRPARASIPRHNAPSPPPAEHPPTRSNGNVPWRRPASQRLWSGKHGRREMLALPAAAAIIATAETNSSHPFTR